MRRTAEAWVDGGAGEAEKYLSTRGVVAAALEGSQMAPEKLARHRSLRRPLPAPPPDRRDRAAHLRARPLPEPPLHLRHRRIDATTMEGPRGRGEKSSSGERGLSPVRRMLEVVDDGRRGHAFTVRIRDGGYRRRGGQAFTAQLMVGRAVRRGRRRGRRGAGASQTGVGGAADGGGVRAVRRGSRRPRS